MMVKSCNLARNEYELLTDTKDVPLPPKADSLVNLNCPGIYIHRPPAIMLPSHRPISHVNKRPYRLF